MKNFKLAASVIISLLLLFICSGICQSQQTEKPIEYLTEPEVLYYSAEMNGIVHGYGETKISEVLVNNNKMILLEEYILIKMTVLGGNVDTEIRQETYLDPRTMNWTYYNSDISQADIQIGSSVTIDNNIAYYTSKVDNSTKEIELDEEVVLENSHFLPHIVKDFVDEEKTRESYKVLDVLKGEIQEKSYTIKGKEKLVLNREEFSTIVLEELNLSTGVARKIWLDTNKLFVVKMVISDRVTISLSDETVIKGISTANLDEVLFGKVETLIRDIHSITYMEVKATIRSAGEWLTAESLSVPGQTFSGTVEDNIIDGIFKIEHPRYDGSGAPGFPFDYKLDKDLKKYLEPGDYIESGDTVLIRKAKEITEGSKDSWEASIRLSKWVSENIKGAVPGGITARKTYDTRSGECSSHSRLLSAFCRGVGIPSRIVAGCMYSTYYGGSFGQHVWNEVYMGDAGWIPIDATIFEIDFVDCGHIRLGEATSFNPIKMEILNYKLKGGPETGEEAIPPEILNKYKKYLGSYNMDNTNKVFKVSVAGENLAVDIPDQMVLVLKKPDENGYWFARLSPMVYFTFTENQEEKIIGMQLHQIVPMIKNSEPDTIPENVPDEFIPYLGKYYLMQAQAIFEVSYKEGALAVFDPFEKRYIALNPPDEKGRWMDEFHKNAFDFEKDATGKVTSLRILQEYFLTKGEIATPIIKEAILTHGAGAGKVQYQEILDAPKGEFILKEQDMNDLGYELMGEDHLEEAIEVFSWNMEAYPESWNVYDSLGEAYMKIGNKKLAIYNYTKSLELNPENENAKKMLLEMKK
ncbi:MAG: transglutaminase domain-containing protein [Bacteroidota bacterium]|nr:transglutaminase domain-containing protein [Bacteroidota bacterium]